MAGPATNLVLSIVSFAIYVYFPHPILLISVAFNAWIALINLIPFGILDGWKVFNWDKVVWGLVFITSVALAIVTSTFLGF
jgi:Zn-dependent protease